MSPGHSRRRLWPVGAEPPFRLVSGIPVGHRDTPGHAKAVPEQAKVAPLGSFHMI